MPLLFTSLRDPNVGCSTVSGALTRNRWLT